MTKIFPNVMKLPPKDSRGSMNSENKIHQGNDTNAIKYIKSGDKEKLLKEAGEKRYRGTKARIKLDF